jgi:uncharacterized membrane protein HdeD (DUF308 family)
MNTLQGQLARTLSRNWSLLLLRGLIAIAFGVLAWLQPASSIAALVLLFGAFSTVDGILWIWIALSGRKQYDWWWEFLVRGLLSVCVGVMTFLKPEITALILLFYIAIWAIATGVLEIAAAIRLRREIKGEWMFILGGLISAAFGVMLMVWPGEGALAVLWLIATYAIVLGGLLIGLAFKVRRIGRDIAQS